MVDTCESGRVDDVAAPAAPSPRVPRPRYGLEVLIVLALTLGQSAVYSILSLINKLTIGRPLSQQTTTMNSSATPERPWLDLAYQLAGNLFPLAQVALVCYLLWLRPGRLIPAGPLAEVGEQVRGLDVLGLRERRPLGDLLDGVVIALCIGIPGLGLYLAAKALGVNTTVAAANLTDQWWTIPILILAAFSNGAVEETIMIGYLFTRLRQRGWQFVTILLVSAVIRGSYHLYQGFGGFVGNLVMGVIFGLVFLRWRRVTPLVIAHTLLDIGAFVGYSLLAPHVGWL